MKSWRHCLATLAVAVAVTLAASPAMAQSDTRDLQNRVDRLERDRAIIRGHHIVGPARRRNEERCQDGESSHGSHSLTLRAH